MQKFIIPLMVVIFLSACASAPPTVASASTEVLISLDDTSLSYDSKDEKAELNHKSVTDVIIQNPAPSALPITEAATEVVMTQETTSSKEFIYHKVEDGDTVYSLAREYGLTPKQIEAYNGLENPDMLTLGQDLIVGEKEVISVKDVPVVVTEESPPQLDMQAILTLDNASYGWSYPASREIELFINEYHAYSRMQNPNRELILTFDCGYNYGDLADRILDTLKEKGVKATFFITGGFLEEVPDTVRRMIDEGHVVGNHTMLHLNGPKTIETDGIPALVSDLRDLEKKYKSLMGESIAPVARAPEGVWSEQTLELTRQLGYSSFFWDLAHRDWETDNQMDPKEALEILESQTRDGAVILLHTVSSTNAAILGDYIDWAKAQGYQFLTALEMK